MNRRQRAPGTVLNDSERQRLRSAIWAVLAGAVLALGGIFGFGALTGAGDFFSDDEAERAAARTDDYWQIWGMLVPLAIAVVISGVALFLLSGSLARIAAGRRAQAITAVHRVVIPLTVLASVPYWFGPEIDEVGVPGWVEAVAGISGIIAYVSMVVLGVAMLGLAVPRWTGAAMIAGALLAVVTFLPLFVFVGTLLASIGLLRWSREPEPAGPLAGEAPAPAHG
jgi:hypothetical protein